MDGWVVTVQVASIKVHDKCNFLGAVQVLCSIVQLQHQHSHYPILSYPIPPYPSVLVQYDTRHRDKVSEQLI